MLVNFSWLVEDQLAGAGQLGGWNHGEQLEVDLGLLYAEGIRAVVSLTERPLETDKIEARNMAYLHLPVQDMSAPTLEDIVAFARFIDQAVDKGLPVVVHCSAGCSSPIKATTFTSYEKPHFNRRIGFTYCILMRPVSYTHLRAHETLR